MTIEELLEELKDYKTPTEVYHQIFGEIFAKEIKEVEQRTNKIDLSIN